MNQDLIKQAWPKYIVKFLNVCEVDLINFTFPFTDLMTDDLKSFNLTRNTIMCRGVLFALQIWFAVFDVTSSNGVSTVKGLFVHVHLYKCV